MAEVSRQDLFERLVTAGTALRPGHGADGSMLLLDPDGVDLGRLLSAVADAAPSQVRLAAWYRDPTAHRLGWEAVRHLPFEARPLLFGGSPETNPNVFPFQFDLVVSMDKSRDPRSRLDLCRALVAAGGLLVRPLGEGGTADEARVVEGVFAEPLASSAEVISFQPGKEASQGPRWHDASWNQARIILEEFHAGGAPGAIRAERLQDGLLRLWSEAAKRTAPPLRWPWSDAGSPPHSLPGNQAWPKISVVIPSYNQGQYIEETLLSLVRQQYPRLEIIVMDGGSTDDTLSVVERYRPRLAQVVSEPDRGQSHAINKGMALAGGDILTWLNSDDMLAEGALHAVALAFLASGADMVAGICRTHRNHVYDGEHLTACAEGVLPLCDLLDLEGGWYAGKFFYQPEVFFTRAIWQKAGGQVRENLYYSMDYELWLRFAAAEARLHVIGRPVALFRRHEGQKTHVAERFMAELVTVRDGYVAEAGAPGGAAPASRPYRVQHLTFCFLNDVGFSGGAGIAHRRLADGLVAAGHSVQTLQFQHLPGIAGDNLPTAAELAAAVATTNCDIVLLGNLHHAGPEPSLFEEVFRRWPTLIVLHDFWWLTGRCAYTGGCRKLETGCDATCPTATQYPALQPGDIRDAWFQKRTLLQAHPNVVLLANSHWTAAFAANTKADPAGGVQQVRIGVDPEYFLPRDKATARSRLGLPQDAFIAVMSTTSLDDPRKGALRLIDALGREEVPDLRVVVLGHVPDRERERLPAFCILPGYVEAREQLLLYYAAADLLIGASTEETFGQVFAEAAALGVPVVAHGGSGVDDAVADGVSGLLTRTASTAELVRLVLMLRMRPDVARMLSELGPVFVRNEYSIEASYRSLYQALGRAGILDRLGVQPNITFTPAERRGSASPGSELRPDGGRDWIAGAGVSWREAANPEHGCLTPFNWLEGPHAEFLIESRIGGRGRVIVEYQNLLFDEQPVEVSVNGSVRLKKRLGRTPPLQTAVFSLEADLTPGRSVLRMQFGRSYRPDGHPRDLALILNALSVFPAPDAPG